MEDKLRIDVIGLIKFIIIWILNGIIWWFLRSYLSFMIAIIMLLAAILSCMVLVYYRKRPVAGIEFSKYNVAKGNELIFCVRVQSEGVLLPFDTKLKYVVSNAFTGEREEYTQKVFVYPKKGATLDYRISLEKCGMLEGRVEQFVIYDFFHILKFYSSNKKDGQAISFPRYNPTDYEELFDMVEDFPKEDESKNMGNDYNLDCEVREYIEGDSLKNIHWKLTAKKDNLMIRERLSTGRQRMNVILQFGEQTEENDALMDSLRWILEEMILKEYPIQLFWKNSVAGNVKSECIAEIGEMERVIYDILSMRAFDERKSVLNHFLAENKGAPYILVMVGEKKGAYIG